MKTAILLLLSIFSLKAATAQVEDQSLGLIAGINYRPAFIPYFNYGYINDFGADKLFDPALVAPVGGFFYNRDLNKRFGLSVAAKYFMQSATFDCRQCRFVDAPTGPLYFKMRENFVEIPVNVAVNLNSNDDTKVRTYFTLGYAYSRLLSAKRTDLKTDEEMHYKGSDLVTDRNTHAITSGFEFRYYKDKLMLAFSPYVQIPFKRPASSNVEMRFIGLQFKAGRNFGKE